MAQKWYNKLWAAWADGRVLPPPLPQELESLKGLRCPHCRKALRLEQYASYYVSLDAKVCPYCDKVMEIGLRLVKADG